MKKIVLIIPIMIFSSVLFAQDFWQRINTPDSLTLTSVLVDSEGSIYISCWNNFYKGGVYRSDDNGLTWIKKNNGFPVSAYPILSLDKDNYGTIYAGTISRIYKTNNKGENWEFCYQTPFYAENYNTIRCGFDSVIIAGGENNEAIVRSGDHGQTWKSVLDLSHPTWFEAITDVQFGPDGVIYACSRIMLQNYPGMIYASYDQGRNWQVFDTADYPVALGFDVEGRLLRGEFGLGLYRYDFMLKEWEHILNDESSPQSILTIPDGKIFLACDNQPTNIGGVLLSENDGNTFNYINSGFGLSNYAKEFAFDQAGKLLVVNGYLFRSRDTILTENQNAILNQAVLKVYPNPFQNKITFLFPSTRIITYPSIVKIYNAEGLLVHKGALNAGREYIWDAREFPLGLYLVKISNDKSTSTAKVLHY